ncbi:MAG: hypothetical protein IPI10_15515 [Bacteroidetes bacterium]|nr:hypothetical protein [Bacteroidota bacterium]
MINKYFPEWESAKSKLNSFLDSNSVPNENVH